MAALAADMRGQQTAEAMVLGKRQFFIRQDGVLVAVEGGGWRRMAVANGSMLRDGRLVFLSDVDCLEP